MRKGAKRAASKVQQLLPIAEIEGVQAGVEGEETSTALAGGATEFEFEPSAGDVLGQLLPHFINFKVHQDSFFLCAQKRCPGKKI